MRRRIILVFGLMILFGEILCQPYVSKYGKFQVSAIAGCAPLDVVVSIDPLYPCGGCDVDLEGNNSFQSTSQTQTFTYNTPGTYWMRVLIGTSPMDSILITVAPNVFPEFGLYTCENNEISVQLNDSNYDEYIIDFNDGSPEVAVAGNAVYDYTYGSASPQTVEVRGHNFNAADNCTADGRIITPLATLPAPVITRLDVIDNANIRLEFNALPNIQYRLGIATNSATNFQQAGTIANVNVDTVRNLRTDDNYYCFQLAAYDPCNNRVINSTTICSANFDIAVRNSAIDVSWTTATAGISSFRLDRNASDGTSFGTSPPASPYTDTDITCGTEYCYQLTTAYPNGSRSVSLVKCGTGFSTETPTAIANITAIVGDASLLLNWQADPDFVPEEFAIEKSVGGSYSMLSTTTQTAFSDPDYSTEEASCYRIRYRDVCGNQSPLSVEVCPIRLTGTLRNDNSISLAWTEYQGWSNGVSNYIVEKYTEDGILLTTFQAGSATSYVDNSDDLDYQTFVYVVRADAAEPGLGQSVSNRVPVLKDPNLFHPTAFTPNGDNLNDNFTVFGQYVVEFDMQIFNRWGEMLFSTKDIQTGWDGTYRGNEMPEGTYTFIAHITDRAGRTFKRSGSVLLLRRE